MSRYTDALHKVQTAIATLIGMGDTLAEPKHLRVGLDARAADHAGLVNLLIAKKVFTIKEYLEAIEASAEAEALRYERCVSEEVGGQVTLL